MARQSNQALARRARQRRSATPTLRAKQTASQETKRQHTKKASLLKRLGPAPGVPGKTTKTKIKAKRRAKIIVLAARKATRERWAAIAEETRQIVTGDGKYVEERRPSAVSSPVAHPDQRLVADGTSQEAGPSTTPVVHDISAQIQLSIKETTFYPHYSGPLAKWASSSRRTATSGTAVEFLHCSTLAAARRLSTATSSEDAPFHPVGVLSFASPKKPGGGYLHGGDEQEEVIARHSSLVTSLSSAAAQAFYQEHRKSRSEDGSGLHDHSMVYSPGVVVFRADPDDTNDDASAPKAVGGAFITPYTINVLSAVPVNAAAVRAKHTILPGERDFFEDGIRNVAKERMARALRVFEERGDRTLVLGAFGCASSENSVEAIAAVWAELLVCGDGIGTDGARFKNVFDRVVFAVPGKHFAKFKEAFEMRVFEAEVASAALTD
ncbi:hypothetical protein PsYK624_075870 [Phanerochaete sordida]|uniref:Microbial-type PARG catalytic domain-containing protein n=1 Tax=Phanerochaete sordida TaxID=48140 RepID=A0A9P3LEX4_9APHY|nr:hypothetical protein PsYK624_075870 [Phanerochaete sordida]